MAARPVVLDTNIILETIKMEPDRNVMAWLFMNEQYLYLTAVTIGELLDGALRLPVGRRRENLLVAMERITSGYRNRILAYDAAAARIYARFAESARNQGRALTVEDGMIAATCIAAGGVLATRNTKDFSYLDTTLINPFEEPTPSVPEVAL
ncbi:MAG: type II toxin-antitoxin system VapC family toxin [Actinomycetia bacterium]|nr:type II toxin-antitoxin system VapC family toxin [Actinomycetes bacterium]